MFLSIYKRYVESIYYDRNKGTLKEYWWNSHDQEGGKEKERIS